MLYVLYELSLCLTHYGQPSLGHVWGWVIGVTHPVLRYERLQGTELDTYPVHLAHSAGQDDSVQMTEANKVQD